MGAGPQRTFAVSTSSPTHPTRGPVRFDYLVVLAGGMAVLAGYGLIFRRDRMPEGKSAYRQGLLLGAAGCVVLGSGLLIVIAGLPDEVKAAWPVAVPLAFGVTLIGTLTQAGLWIMRWARTERLYPGGPTIGELERRKAEQRAGAAAQGGHPRAVLDRGIRVANPGWTEERQEEEDAARAAAGGEQPEAPPQLPPLWEAGAEWPHAREEEVDRAESLAWWRSAASWMLCLALLLAVHHYARVDERGPLLLVLGGALFRAGWKRNGLIWSMRHYPRRIRSWKVSDDANALGMKIVGPILVLIGLYLLFIDARRVATR